MKLFFVIAAMLVSASAFADKTCVGLFGEKAVLKGNLERLAIVFPAGGRPGSGYLKYVGQRSTSFYFAQPWARLEVQKSVFKYGTGNVWYHYTSDRHSITAKFNCN